MPFVNALLRDGSRGGSAATVVSESNALSSNGSSCCFVGDLVDIVDAEEELEEDDEGTGKECRGLRGKSAGSGG